MVESAYLARIPAEKHKAHPQSGRACFAVTASS